MEYRRKCNVCGKIYCYTDKEVSDNARNAAMGALSAVGTIASVFSGPVINTMYLNNQTDKYTERTRDFTRCPSCGSQSTEIWIGDFEENSNPALAASNNMAVQARRTIEINANASRNALLKRAKMFMEDGDWESADAYCNNVLDMDPENADAYLGKLMIECKVSELDQLLNSPLLNADSPNYRRYIKFANNEIALQLIRSTSNRAEILKKKQKNYSPLYNSIICTSAEEYSTIRIAYAVNKFGVLERTVSDNVKATAVIPTDKHDNIKAISGSNGTIAILKNDGTVSLEGVDCSKYNVSEWRNVVQIALGLYFVVGLKSDGTVLVEGKNFQNQKDAESWKDIVQISASDSHILGLTISGKVLAAGDDSFGRTNVASWENISMVAAQGHFSFGLKKDGTVIATNYSSTNANYGEDMATSWRNIKQISASNTHILGLTSDGRVLASGCNEGGGCDVAGWNNIVAVIANSFHSYGIKADGTVVAAGSNEKSNEKIKLDAGPCDVQHWKLFDSYDTYEEEVAESISKGREYIALKKAEAEEKRKSEEAAKKEMKRKALLAEKKTIEETLPSLTGFFAKGKKAKMETRLSEICEELNRMI